MGVSRVVVGLGLPIRGSDAEGIPTSSDPGTEYLQFSPVDDPNVVGDMITRNARALMGDAH
jgi:hypothetical protein